MTLIESKTWTITKIYITSFRHRTFQLLKENPLLVLSFPILLVILFVYYSYINKSFGNVKSIIDSLPRSEAIKYYSTLVIDISSILTVSTFFISFLLNSFINKNNKNNILLTLGMESQSNLIRIKSILVALLILLFYSVLGIFIFVINIISIGSPLSTKNLNSNNKILVLYKIILVTILFFQFFIIPFVFGLLGGASSYLFKVLGQKLVKYDYIKWTTPLSILIMLLTAIVLSFIIFESKNIFHIELLNYFIFSLSENVLASNLSNTKLPKILSPLLLIFLELSLLTLIFRIIFKLTIKNRRTQITEELMNLKLEKDYAILSHYKNWMKNFHYKGFKRWISQLTTDMKILLRSEIFSSSLILSTIIFFLILFGRLLYKNTVSTDLISPYSIFQGFLPFTLIICFFVFGFYSRIFDSGMDCFIFTSSYDFKVYTIIKFFLLLFTATFLGMFYIELLNLFIDSKIDFWADIFPYIIIMASIAIFSSFFGYFLSPSRSSIDTEGQLLLAIIIFLILNFLLSILLQMDNNVNRYFLLVIILVLTLFTSFSTKRSDIV